MTDKAKKLKYLNIVLSILLDPLSFYIAMPVVLSVFHHTLN